MEMSNVRKWGTNETLAFGETVDRATGFSRKAECSFEHQSPLPLVGAHQCTFAGVYGLGIVLGGVAFETKALAHPGELCTTNTL